ncbi:MAG: M50 family metallopeptidase, partial [Oscillospiraceae bacterium]
MIFTIIGAILIFSIIIFVHELGHFLAARAFGVTVHEFAIGMGPTLFKKQGKNTLYSIRAIPMGGFCAMEGEDQDSDDPGAFSKKKPLPRIIILIAGAAMNLLLGFIIVTCLVATTTITTGGMYGTQVDNVDQTADAARFLEKGDKIVGINGKTVHIRRDLTFELSQSGGAESTLTYKRDGKKYTESFKPTQTTYEDGSQGYVVGFTIAHESGGLFGILHESFFQTVWMVKLVFVSLGMLINGGAKMTDLSGPVGVVSAMNTVAQSGLMDFLFFAAFLAVNIGIMNVLPLPALDGGRIAFVIYELIFRKPVPLEKEA